MKQTIAAALVAGLALDPVAVLAGAGPNAGAVSGSLAIQSDPVGANVYVDGKLAGHTPLQVAVLEPGDHRVRVVKDGYLENARVVTVGAAEAKSVHVKLTPHTGSSNAASTEQVSGGGGGGGGGSKKWLWIGIAGGGGLAAFLYATRNKPPVVGSISFSPSTGIVATNVSFTAQGASDPDNDPLTYSWNFGDGGTDSSATPNHVFSTAGTFTVTVTVSDGKASASASGSITVRSLAGTWSGPLQNLGVTVVTLNQNGTSLTGTYRDQIPLSGTVSGSVNATTRGVSFTVTVPGFNPFTFTGNPNADVSTLSGTVNGSGFVNVSYTLTR